MSEQESRLRSLLVTYFPMLIAVLSLVTSIFNGFLNARFVDIIQRNVGRTEYLRTCKEIIDAYFQVKFRASLVSTASERASAQAPGTEQIEAANAVAKFAALGTYLANLRDDATRARYTELSRQLDKIAGDARGTPPAELPKLFAPADRMFAAMNEDCINSAKQAPM